MALIPLSPRVNQYRHHTFAPAILRRHRLLPHHSLSMAAESKTLMPNYSTTPTPQPLPLSIHWPAETTLDLLASDGCDWIFSLSSLSTLPPIYCRERKQS
ncbi:hypothetical protein VNO80_25411 [Phaseolus coccineus]|uniref:Uncharacterized protein n=1 Tax=Phaseolus coccineus TaxID=3886 RepID=A0AAN9LZ54_PHACN